MTSSRFVLSSAVVTVLISLLSVSIVTSLAPVTSKQTYSPSSRHFQISPVPPGADWTS
jgi:hypothetical protein